VITKDKLRYVGTLLEINAKDQSVALKMITCYGTEGRRPENEIPAKQGIIAVKNFPGSGIQDLKVLAGEPAVTTETPEV